MTQSPTSEVSRFLTQMIFYFTSFRNYDAAHVNRMVEGRTYGHNSASLFMPLQQKLLPVTFSVVSINVL